MRRDRRTGRQRAAWQRAAQEKAKRDEARERVRTLLRALEAALRQAVCAAASAARPCANGASPAVVGRPDNVTTGARRRGKRAGHTPLELAGVTDAPTLAEALNQLCAAQPGAVSQPAQCYTFAEIFGLAVAEPASLQLA